MRTKPIEVIRIVDESELGNTKGVYEFRYTWGDIFAHFAKLITESINVEADGLEDAIAKADAIASEKTQKLPPYYSKAPERKLKRVTID